MIIDSKNEQQIVKEKIETGQRIIQDIDRLLKKKAAVQSLS